MRSEYVRSAVKLPLHEKKQLEQGAGFAPAPDVRLAAKVDSATTTNIELLENSFSLSQTEVLLRVSRVFHSATLAWDDAFIGR